MGAQTIKRDKLKHEKRTRQLLRAKLATVAVVQELGTGAILSIGVDYPSAVSGLSTEMHSSGRWEVKEYRLCR